MSASLDCVLVDRIGWLHQRVIACFNHAAGRVVEKCVLDRRDGLFCTTRHLADGLELDGFFLELVVTEKDQDLLGELVGRKGRCRVRHLASLSDRLLFATADEDGHASILQQLCVCWLLLLRLGAGPGEDWLARVDALERRAEFAVAHGELDCWVVQGLSLWNRLCGEKDRLISRVSHLRTVFRQLPEYSNVLCLVDFEYTVVDGIDRPLLPDVVLAHRDQHHIAAVFLRALKELVDIRVLSLQPVLQITLLSDE